MHNQLISKNQSIRNQSINIDQLIISIYFFIYNLSNLSIFSFLILLEPDIHFTVYKHIICQIKNKWETIYKRSTFIIYIQGYNRTSARPIDGSPVFHFHDKFNHKRPKKVLSIKNSKSIFHIIDQMKVGHRCEIRHFGWLEITLTVSVSKKKQMKT